MNDILSAFADGALDPAAHEQVADHLKRCPDCAAGVTLQTFVREAIGAHRDALRELAPADLRARVAAMVSPARVLPFPVGRPAAPRRRWARGIPASLAAGLLLAAAAGAMSPTGSVLAAQLALDHLKCRAIAHVSSDADPVDQAGQWERARGWHVEAPPSRPDLGLSFVGMRHCLYHEGSMAHLMYDYRGHRVSVFVLPQREAGTHDVALLGQQTHAWAAGGRTYALVSDVGAGDLADVVDYVRDTLR